MSLLTTLERVSFKKVLGLSLVIALILAIPVTILVSQQKTRLASKAFFEKPEPIKPIKIYGNPSQNDPIITLVWPFLGKVGDAVLIEGENFGDNPAAKKLFLGSTPIPEDNILQWTPTLIEFTLPQNSGSDFLSLAVAGKQTSWPYFFTVYNVDTKIQVTENNDIVKVINAPLGSKLEIFFNDGTKIESFQTDNTPVPGNLKIISVLLKDQAGAVLPFFVEPDEFGF